MGEKWQGKEKSVTSPTASSKRPVGPPSSWVTEARCSGKCPGQPPGLWSLGPGLMQDWLDLVQGKSTGPTRAAREHRT